MSENINQFLFNTLIYWKEIIIHTYQSYPTKTLIYLILIFILIFFLKKLPQTSYLYALLTLPATIMHELTHLVLSILTFGKPTKINLLPKKTENGIIYGYVENSNITYYNAIFIGLAPLILLVFGFIFIFKYLIPETNIYLIVWYFYISLMFIEGGIPSRTDLKIALISWPLILIIGVVFLFVKF